MSKSTEIMLTQPRGLQKEISKRTKLTPKTVCQYFKGRKCSLDTQLKIKQAIKEIESEL